MTVRLTGMLNTKNIKKASKTVIECELRAAWQEVECDIRHAGQPGKAISDYVALLTKELSTRG